jgi:DNA-binding HxlR family transcriptional regulator
MTMPATKRTYADRCGIARALDAVGERWALLVVRELLLGPKRFTDLRAGLPGVATDILAQRLRELEATGIVARRTLAPPAASKVYELTPRGAELEPVILALGRWGSTAPFPPSPDATIGVDAFAIALKTLFDPRSARRADTRVALVLSGQPFRARAHQGRLELLRGDEDAPQATIAAEPPALAAAMWHGRDLDAGGIEITGDRRAARRFLSYFPLGRTDA